MAASSLLKQVAAPTKQEVQDTLGGVLCRCTGYQKIVEAVMAAAEGLAQDAPLTDAPFTDPGAGAAVGARLVKTDGPAKVTGRELYGADRSEEHTSELQSLMRNSYAVFCLNTKKTNIVEKSKQKTETHKHD